MYDGFAWRPMPDLSTVRDRPACSLAQYDDGKVGILVAGGCNGWCVENPAIASAEIFDLTKWRWRRVSNLPKPISSAKLEMLDGLPTVVGGYDNEQRNELLYQVIRLKYVMLFG